MCVLMFMCECILVIVYGERTFSPISTSLILVCWPACAPVPVRSPQYPPLRPPFARPPRMDKVSSLIRINSNVLYALAYCSRKWMLYYQEIYFTASETERKVHARCPPCRSMDHTLSSLQQFQVGNENIRSIFLLIRQIAAALRRDPSDSLIYSSRGIYD